MLLNALRLVDLVTQLVHGGDFDELTELSNDWFPKCVHFDGALAVKLSFSQLDKFVCRLLLLHFGHCLINHTHCVVFQLGACFLVSRPELN